MTTPCWDYNSAPTARGWYPVLRCWDGREGSAGACYWNGERWNSVAVIAFVNEPKTDSEAAADRAYELDPERKN